MTNALLASTHRHVSCRGSEFSGLVDEKGELKEKYEEYASPVAGVIGPFVSGRCKKTRFGLTICDS